MVLAEFLNHFSGMGRRWRDEACGVVDDLRQSASVAVVGHPLGGFDAALGLYRRHDDKAWSLVDCSSISIMQVLGIAETVSDDHHFRQAGFTLLP
jgi:predicted nucleic acid-binding protein